MKEREKYHAHGLHESDTWENRHALRWELGCKATRCTARGAGEQNWLACWHLVQSCQRLCLTASWPLVNWRVLSRDGGPTSVYDRKDGEAIYLYWSADDVCLLTGQRSMNKEARGSPRVSQVRFLTICLLC